MISQTRSLAALLFSLALSITANAESGGISGGGGGTLPADQVDIAQLTEAAADSRRVIDVYLKGIETNIVLDDGSLPQSHFHNYEKMFGPGKDVFKFLGTVPFRLVTQGACHGTDGVETDASANTDIEGGICLSISRIQPKVTWANYRAEIGALILHEIAHLFGSDETEALAIQRIAVRFFAGKDPSDVGEWTFRLMESTRNLSAMTDLMNDVMKSGAPIACDKMEKLADNYMTVVHELSDGGSGMFLTRERDSEFYWQLPTRIKAMTDYLCTLPGYTYEPIRYLHVERFEKIWRTDSELSADQYFKRAVNDSSSFNRFPLVTLKIKKYSSVAEIPADLERSMKDLEALTKMLHDEWNQKFTF